MLATFMTVITERQHNTVVAPPDELTYEQQLARRGAEILDKERPGWHKKVNPANLNVHSAKQCVLKQLYGDFGVGRSDLIGRGYPIYDLLGFHAFGDKDKLNEAWRDEIAARRA